MEVASYQYSEKGFFHDIGIDGADTSANRGRWKLRRLSTIMAHLGHTGVRSMHSFTVLLLCHSLVCFLSQ